MEVLRGLRGLAPKPHRRGALTDQQRRTRPQRTRFDGRPYCDVQRVPAPPSVLEARHRHIDEPFGCCALRASASLSIILKKRGRSMHLDAETEKETVQGGSDSVLDMSDPCRVGCYTGRYFQFSNFCSKCWEPKDPRFKRTMHLGAEMETLKFLKIRKVDEAMDTSLLCSVARGPMLRKKRRLCRSRLPGRGASFTVTAPAFTGARPRGQQRRRNCCGWEAVL